MKILRGAEAVKSDSQGRFLITLPFRTRDTRSHNRNYIRDPRQYQYNPRQHLSGSTRSSGFGRITSVRRIELLSVPSSHCYKQKAGQHKIQRDSGEQRAPVDENRNEVSRVEDERNDPWKDYREDIG